MKPDEPASVGKEGDRERQRGRDGEETKGFGEGEVIEEDGEIEPHHKRRD